MKNIIVAFAMVFASTSALAEKPVATRPAGAPASSSSIQWAVSGPLTLVGGTALFGAYVSGLIDVAPNLQVGGESGLMVGSNTWVIPILLTGLYHFNLQGNTDIAPFVGLGIGLGIFNSPSATINATTLTLTSSRATSAEFEAMAHLGAAFGPTKNWFADIRLGTVASSFLFAPTVGYRF